MGGLMVPDRPKTASEGSGFYEVEHTADRALHITGADMEAFLTHAAHGMISLMGLKTSDLALEETREFSLKAFDKETLLVEWLNELLFWAETRRIVFHHFDFLDTGEHGLRVILSGGTVPTLEVHIKAVTYHDLRVTRSENGFQATVVFDV